MELSAEGKTPEYMALAGIKFKLTLPQLKNNPELKEQLLQGIKAGNMAPYYKEVCADLGWSFDQKLYDQMTKENQDRLSKFQEDDSETPVWQDRLDYLCSIGDKEAATTLATAKYEDSTLTTNRRLDAIFALFRISYFHGCNVKDMGKAINKAHELVDKGGDWRSRNKLKAYEAIYCLAVRDYSHAADLFIDCVSTFESYELVDFGTIIQYCVLACALALERHALQAALRRQGAAVQALRSRFPELRELVESLHECRYADFMKSLAWVETQICVDPVFRPHYQHYVREARIKAYVQLLRAYRSLSLDNIADTFGVTREFIEEEISTILAARSEYIQTINSSSGIYFDPIGDLKIRVSHLDIVTPLDISFIDPHIKNLHSILSTLRFLCNQIEIETSKDLECHTTIEPLSIRLNDIISGYSSLSHLVDKRSKRGAWLGGVGILSKTIFGTLDEDDAIKYDNAIQDIQNSQKRMASLIKDNVLITSTVLSEFNNTIHKIKMNEARLNEAIDDISSKLKNISFISDDLLIRSKINSVLNTIEASILTLSFQVEDITNAVVLASRNIIHPAILSPEELYHEIVNNFRYLPTDYKLPLDLALSNIHAIINVSSVLCYSSNNKIVFVLRIPIVSPKEFNIFHNIALPTPHDIVNLDSFSFIIPNHKYIAMTKDKSEYCNIDSLRECVAVNSKEFICDVMSTYPTVANPICESVLLSSVNNKLPPQCHTDFIHGHIDLWKPLSTNNWIFVQSSNTKLYLECPNKSIINFNILGTGILNIPIGCVAYCRNTKLIPRLTALKLNFSKPIVDFNIVKDSCCSIDKISTTTKNESPIKLQDIDLDLFTSESKSKLKSIAVEADKIINQHYLVKYETHFSIVLLIIIIIISVFFICKLFYFIKLNDRLPFRSRTSFQPSPTNSPDPAPQANSVILPLTTTRQKVEPEIIPPGPSIRKNLP